MAGREKIHSGELYLPGDPQIMAEQLKCVDMLNEYNAIPRTEPERREQMLRRTFAEVGDNCYIESPFYANWGGHHVHLGAGVIVLPGVTIGDDTVIGAGSVVTKDIPAGVVAVGNPCRVIREVGARDRKIDSVIWE